MLADVNKDVLRLYKNLCPNAETRYFDFSQYPEYVKTPLEYRYKHILVAEVLMKEKLILFVDASIIFHYNSTYTFKVKNIHSYTP